MLLACVERHIPAVVHVPCFWGRGEEHQGSQDPGAPINHSLWELVQRVGLYLRICLFKQNPLN